jgi:PAS domain S-box-containing protein
MSIRYKLLAGLLGVPIIFTAVAIFLIVTNRQVQADSRELATFHTKLGMSSARLSVTLITAQKAAEELMAETSRARYQQSVRDDAEESAQRAEELIKINEAQVDDILNSLIIVTNLEIDEVHKSGDPEDVAAAAVQLESLHEIELKSSDYKNLLNKYISVAKSNPDNADEVLNQEVEPVYEQQLLPLVQKYAAARDDDVIRKSSEIEQSVSRVTRLAAQSAISSLLLAALIGIFLSHSFSKPLKKLAVAATQIGKGLLASRIEVKSNDEIGFLAQAFNQMADDLKHTTVSKDYFDSIIRSMGDSLVVVSAEGRIGTVNNATCEMLGYRERELLGQPLKMIFANDKGCGSESLPTQIVDSECTYLAKDGSTIAVAFSSRLMQLVSGQPQGLVCVAKNITELKLAAERIRQSEHKLALHIQRTPLAVIEWNLNAQIVEWNPAAEAIFGYRKEEVLGRQVVELLVPASYRQKAIQEWNDLLSQKIGRHVTYHNLTKDGRTIICEWYNTPLDSQGRVIGVASMVQDFTERTRMEQELKEMRDTAIESARLKSEFLANMSHEIRTPMNGVIGMTGLLLDTELTPEQRDFAETIQSSGDALLTIINDILDFSKIEAGKLKFETLDFDLRNAVESTIEMFAERAHSKRLELASLICSDVPIGLRGDPGRLRQVLTNLIGNAIKFTEHGEVVVRVEKEHETDADVMIRFSVRDSGIGISESAQRNLFQAFTQADGSTTRKYGGTGLGLAISKQLVELMGGQIALSSVEGKGSTFWFAVRFGKQSGQVIIRPPSSEKLAGLQALIVDDNSTNRKILSHQLSSWGMTYHEVDSGRAALESLRSAVMKGEPYDLAVLDLMMPEMDGFELARAIKSDPLIAHVRLVLLTSFGRRGDSTSAREAGIAAYLTKPIRQSQLFECLANVVSKTPSAITPIIGKEAHLITRHQLAEKKPMSNKLILIAEDNVVNQKVAVRQLQKLGYRADTVADGREALEALQRIAYDLVLMDCQMPEMDGYEATAQIRWREGRTKHTPIIAMTAHALEGERAKCLAAGMDDYVSKPVKPEELAAVLGKFLSADGERPASSTELSSETMSPPVNIKRLHEAIGEEPDELHDILDIYVTQMEKSLKELTLAIAKEDFATVELIAHNCAGTSANCGMTAVVDSLQKLEKMGHENRLTGAAQLADKAKREFGRIKVFLDERFSPVVV